MEIEHEATRTLVKSPPELWAELSAQESLARHLEEFREIRITKVEPETAVAWEGELACGTVRLEPSGWGTKVILTAKLVPAAAPVAASAPAPVPAEPEREPEPEVAPPPVVRVTAARVPPRPRGLIARLLALFQPPVAAPQPTAVATPPSAAPPAPPAAAPRAAPPAPAPVAVSRPPALDAEAILNATLDRLGQAHHRPFSRA